MKKHLKLIIILLAIIAVAVSSILIIKLNGENRPPVIIDPNSGDVAIDTEFAAKETVKDVFIKIKTDNRNIDCVYPAITSLSDKEFENYINNTIAQNIQAYRNEIEIIVDEETPDTALYSYITSYDRYNSNKYLSLVISQDYQTGGIRSNRWKDIYNINVKTNRLFYLNELFEPGINFENAIISEITNQAATKNYELMGGNGLTKLSTKQKFYIKDNKLVIYFDPSEVAATVFGELHFEMPFVMNSDGYFEI